MDSVLLFAYFYVIFPDAVLRDNVNERLRLWSQKMIAELDIRPFLAILSGYSGFSWLKKVVLSV